MVWLGLGDSEDRSDLVDLGQVASCQVPWTAVGDRGKQPPPHLDRRRWIDRKDSSFGVHRGPSG